MDSLIKQFSQSSQLSGGNAGYIEDLYEQYLLDPDSVGPKWKAYFDATQGREAGDVPHSVVMAQVQRAAREARFAPAAAGGIDEEAARKQNGVAKLVTAYRSRGHLAARLDPLGMTPPEPSPDLEFSAHDLTDADLDREFAVGTSFGGSRYKLRDLLAKLAATYTGSIGVEFMHISDGEQRRWIHQRLENAAGNFGYAPEARKRILERLTAAEGLERYLHTKYVGQKRFSLEGGDSLIPLMDTLIRRGGSDGVKDVVIGMAHRGRLNVLINTLGKPTAKLFAEFEGKFDYDESPEHSGDVKYHMGFSADVATPGGPVHIALAFNPSHLEIVDPVVAGSVRARQMRRGDTTRRQVLPILI
ncbi:MAG: 2-oxoglutarate dehydrogenase E1 subunit family protein, partial [Arenimonas sp.]